MKSAAFDAKDFRRTKIEFHSNPDNPSEKEEIIKEFYTPLGTGVVFENSQEFVEDYISINIELSDRFFVKHRRPFYSSFYLKEDIGLRKTIRFCDELITRLSDHISKLHICYLILSKEKHPTVKVGGSKSPEKEIETPKFLRNMQPMFSYITAWNFQRRNKEKYNLLIDGFSSKETIAWRELINYNENITIYPHGDECNPFISVADIMAFLTDAKLYNVDRDHRHLFPENVEFIWEEYSFEIDCFFLDDKIFSKYKWEGEDLIDISDYLARPVVFVIVDEIEKLLPKHISNQYQTTFDGDVFPSKERKFKKILQKLPPYQYALKYAIEKGGCIQFFDPKIDSDKVRDGDIVVYAGETSKKIADTLSDIFDIEVLKLKELKSKIERNEKGKRANDA